MPSFGVEFTDHMVQIKYDEDLGGWQESKITPVENISLHPSAKVFHYAITVFEGMKAYKGKDGKVRLFRPLLNFERLNRSIQRVCLPTIDPALALQWLEKLLQTDYKQVPDNENCCVYVRPTVIGTDSDLSLQVCKKALFFILLSPVEPYFSGPIKLYADPSYVRAWPGGTGDHKLGANYASPFYVQKIASENNCQQVMWTHGEDEKLSEAGPMNLFVYYINEHGDKELATPPLDGIVLPGITRRSLMEVAKTNYGCNVTERYFSMNEIRSLLKENKILELFGCGTACVVSPIAEIVYKNVEVLKFPTAEQDDPLFERLRNDLLNIQYGIVDHPWAHIVSPAD